MSSPRESDESDVSDIPAQTITVREVTSAEAWRRVCYARVQRFSYGRAQCAAPIYLQRMNRCGTL